MKDLDSLEVFNMVDEKTIKKQLETHNCECLICKKHIKPEEYSEVIYVGSKNKKISLIHKKCFRSGK